MDSLKTDYNRPVDKDWVERQFLLYDQLIKEYIADQIGQLVDIRKDEVGNLIVDYDGIKEKIITTNYSGNA